MSRDSILVFLDSIATDSKYYFYAIKFFHDFQLVFHFKTNNFLRGLNVW